jgi:DNA-binding transcriptional ArsR family regulator
VRILAALGKRVASPSDIARDIDADLTLVSYHFRVLRDVGLVKRVRSATRRGARETFYMAADPPVLDKDAWAQASEVIKQVIVHSALRTIGERVNESARAGGFERIDAHLTHTPLLLDEQGWKEAATRAEEFQVELQKIGDRAEKRIAGKKVVTPLDCSAVLMLFTSGEP